MAISIHTAQIEYPIENNGVVPRITQDLVNAPSSSGRPTVDGYLVLEAGLGYLPIPQVTPNRLITAKVADINAS